jgi:outer membrane immunogenic protein
MGVAKLSPLGKIDLIDSLKANAFLTESPHGVTLPSLTKFFGANHGALRRMFFRHASQEATRFAMIIARLGVAAIAAIICVGAARSDVLPPVNGSPVFVPPPPVFSWTGIYAGVNLGFGFGTDDPTYGVHNFFYQPPQIPQTLPGAVGAAWVGHPHLSGVLGGGQLGYNYQFNPWLVVGVETDIQGADLRSSTFSYAIPDVLPVPHYGGVLAKQSVDFFGTVRGRIGVTPFDPRLLIYATGGFAYGGVGNAFQYADIFPTLPTALFGGSYYSSTKTGWTAGGGFEYAPLEFPNWTLKAEYLYVDLGRTSISTGGAGLLLLPVIGARQLPVPGFFAATQDPSTRFHTVRIGLNYHFIFAPPPVVAKY